MASRARSISPASQHREQMVGKCPKTCMELWSQHSKKGFLPVLISCFPLHAWGSRILHMTLHSAEQPSEKAQKKKKLFPAVPLELFPLCDLQWLWSTSDVSLLSGSDLASLGLGELEKVRASVTSDRAPLPASSAMLLFLTSGEQRNFTPITLVVFCLCHRLGFLGSHVSVLIAQCLKEQLEGCSKQMDSLICRKPDKFCSNSLLFRRKQ